MRYTYKKGTALFTLFAASLIFTSFNFAKEEAAKGAVTQGEFAKELGNRMDVDVPRGAPTSEYFKALEARGVKPSEGWKEEGPVTAQDVKEVLVEAGRLQAEVMSGKDVESVLRERGIVVPKEINKKMLDDLFKDQDVNTLLNAPATSISGPTIPSPLAELKTTPLAELKTTDEKPKYVTPELEVPPTTEEPATTEPPDTELPPPPTQTTQPRPSGGGGE